MKYRRPRNVAAATKGRYLIDPEVAKEITKEFLASQAAKESSEGTQIEAKGGAGNVTKEVLGAERHYSVSEKTDGAPGIASKDAGQGSDESGMPKRAEAPISAEELREPTASPKQFAANRQNAVKSTGPRTDAGKRKVGRNRAKWNLCAKDVVITEGEGKERIKDFEALRDGLYEYWNPTGHRRRYSSTPSRPPSGESVGFIGPNWARYAPSLIPQIAPEHAWKSRSWRTVSPAKPPWEPSPGMKLGWTARTTGL